MKRALLMLLASLAVGSPVSADPADAVLPWANGLREATGRASPLESDEAISRTAAAYAEVLAAAGILSHESPGDRSLFPERYARGGGTEIFIAEILGAGPDLGRVEAAWEASEPHRRAVVDPRYTRLGAGEAASGSQQVWVVIFARKVFDDLSVEAVGRNLLIEGTLADPEASAPFLEEGASLAAVAPVQWQPESRRFSYRIMGGAAGGHWLLGFRSADTGNPEITNSVTWPPAWGSPAGATRSSEPSAPL
jgi:hypothetical protein